MFLGKIFRKKKKHFVSWLAFHFIHLLFPFLLNVFKTFFLGQCPIVCILYLFSNYFKFCLVLLGYFWTEFFIYFGEAVGSETVVLEDRLPGNYLLFHTCASCPYACQHFISKPL